jgi:hypothetical protein
MAFLGGWLLIGLMWALPTHGQLVTSELPRHVVKLNPLSLAILTLNAKLERRLNERFSGQVGVYVGAPRLKYKADSLPRGIQYFMLGITPELRFHVNFNHRPNPSGAFVAAYCKYTFVKERYASLAYEPDDPGTIITPARIRRHVGSLGFLIGYQFLFKERFALDLYIGPQYSASATLREATCRDCDGDEALIGRPGLRFDGVEPRAGIAVGYAF